MPFRDPYPSTVADTLPRRFAELENLLEVFSSGTVPALQSSINNVSTRVDSATAAISQAFTSIANNSAAIAALQTSVNNVSTRVDSATAAISALQSSINNVSTRVDSVVAPSPYICAGCTANFTVTTVTTRVTWSTHNGFWPRQVFTDSFPTDFLVFPQSGVYTVDVIAPPGTVGTTLQWTLGLVATDTVGTQIVELDFDKRELGGVNNPTYGGGVNRINITVVGTTTRGLAATAVVDTPGSTLFIQSNRCSLIVAKVGN